VRFRFMAGMAMIVDPKIARMFMRMTRSGAVMRMVMTVPVRMGVGMLVTVLMAVFLISVCMLMRVDVFMAVRMLVLVVVFSCHDHSSCSADCEIMITMRNRSFMYFSAVCQRVI